MTATVQHAEPVWFTYALSLGTRLRNLSSHEVSDFTLDSVPLGADTVRLTGVPGTCTGAAPRAVSVNAGDTSSVTFVIACSVRTTGDLDFIVTTSGDEPDDTYFFYHGARYRNEFPNLQTYPAVTKGNDSLRLQFLTAGEHTLSLQNVQSNCVTPANQLVTIAPGSLSKATFSVTCAASGYVRILGTSTGIDRDPDGTVVTFDQGTAVSVPADSSRTIRLSVGSHAYTVADLQPNCVAASALSGTLTLAAGDTVTLDATAQCDAVGPGVLLSTVSDPIGDVSSGADISKVSVYYASGLLRVVVKFGQPPSTFPFGALLIDSDENPLTGTHPTVGGSQNTALGRDWWVNFTLSVPGASYLYDHTSIGVKGQVPLRQDGDSLVVLIPPVKLGGDDGNVAVVVTVGDDYAPSTGVLTAHLPGTVPETAPSRLYGESAAVLKRRASSRRTGSDVRRSSITPPS